MLTASKSKVLFLHKWICECEHACVYVCVCRRCWWADIDCNMSLTLSMATACMVEQAKIKYKLLSRSIRLGGTVVMKLIHFLGIIYLPVQNASKGSAMASSFAFEIWIGLALLGKNYPFCILPEVIKMEKKSFKGKIWIWNDLFKMKNWIKMQTRSENCTLYPGSEKEGEGRCQRCICVM